MAFGHRKATSVVEDPIIYCDFDGQSVAKQRLGKQTSTMGNSVFRGVRAKELS
jgi:hypothetical protein